MTEPTDNEDVFGKIFGTKKVVIKRIDDINESHIPNLRLQFLRISPSYNLAIKLLAQKKKLDNPKVIEEIVKLYEIPAHQLKKRKFYELDQERFTNEQRKVVLEGFLKVVDTAKKFGDLNHEHNGKVKVSPYLYTTTRYINYPYVGLIGVINERGQPHKRFLDDLKKFSDWMQDENAFEPSLVLLVPLRANKIEAKKALYEFLDEYRNPNVNTNYPEKIPLYGKRIHGDAVLKKLKLLIARHLYPELALWEIALKINISQEYTDRKKDQGELYEADIMRLNIITSRMLLQAKTLAENAALGYFPMMNKIWIPNYDSEKTLERIQKIWPNLKP